MKKTPQTAPVQDISPLPQHVAFIMDGNGRWAEQKGLPRMEGHRAGVDNIRAIIRRLSDYKIKYMTVYAFSTENWSRPRKEVTGLMGLLREVIKKETQEFKKNGIKLRHLGQREGLSDSLLKAIDKSMEVTKEGTAMTVCFAFNYGGRQEIMDAARRIIAQGIPPGDIDERVFSKNMYTAGLPDVDLVVRTGGELRISNFLLWQAAYSEFYFTPVLWPAFDTAELDKALTAFSQRKRRFGGI